MNFTKNEVKVYNNSELMLYQRVHLELLVSELSEINSLLTLFCKNEMQSKVHNKEQKYDKYKAKLMAKITNSKRLLKNTKIRLNNNINKCLT